MWQRIKRRILAGLLAMLPLVATYWVVSILFKFLGDLASPFLEQLGIKIPGLGIILTLLVIFLIGLGMLLSFNGHLNVNRILVYGFGSCLIYRFVESLVVDSISVFSLPYILQAFPLLMIPAYYLIKKRFSL